MQERDTHRNGQEDGILFRSWPPLYENIVFPQVPTANPLWFGEGEDRMQTSLLPDGDTQQGLFSQNPQADSSIYHSVYPVPTGDHLGLGEGWNWGLGWPVLPLPPNGSIFENSQVDPIVEEILQLQILLNLWEEKAKIFKEQRGRRAEAGRRRREELKAKEAAGDQNAKEKLEKQRKQKREAGWRRREQRKRGNKSQIGVKPLDEQPKLSD